LRFRACPVFHHLKNSIYLDFRVISIPNFKKDRAAELFDFGGPGLGGCPRIESEKELKMKN
jgi:hypothetical protein